MNDDGGWCVWVLRCMACGHPMVSVAPESALPPFECSVCHEMTAAVDLERMRRVEVV